MRYDIAAGHCERGDCAAPYTHAVRWDEIGAPEPAFACALHANRRRHAHVRVQPVAEFITETGKQPLEVVGPRAA